SRAALRARALPREPRGDDGVRRHRRLLCLPRAGAVASRPSRTGGFCMKNFVCALASALAVAAAMPAAADDSSAALGAGGLVLVKQADIRMAKEDLYISPKEVRVRYEFANDGAKDVDTVVAFPMPDIDVREFWYEPLGTTLDRQPNFMGFALRVDGRAVE